MTKKYKKIVYIGRMQPPTKAHIANIETALELADSVLVLLGSCYQPRTIKNPWNVFERAAMILNQLPPEASARITFRGLHDFRYNDQEWVQQVQQIVKKETLGYLKPKIGIIGCKKDDSSYYLDYFPQWSLIEMDQLEDVNATTVRDEYFSETLFNWKDKDLISSNLTEFLRKWTKTPEYQELVKEYQFIKDYKKGWENSPYSPTFVTVDSVVIQSGHVLLIQRKASPGKGLWALPGGFINQDEYVITAMLRELREETKLKVPTAVVAGSIKGTKVFDYPGRSLRGRTITHAYAIELPPGELSKVKGGDDAAKAKWFPISDVLDMEEQLFEDHSDIIRWAISTCKQAQTLGE